MKKNNKIFIFDMDGVIIDTIGALYQTYLEFLNEFQIKGTEEEFEILNGPKIEDIVKYLKTKYNLRPNKEELLKKYNKKIESIYSKVTLIEGIKEILELLKENELKIALASSSKMENIKFVLKKFNLEQYFSFIVSGDDVIKSKPSPEIYNLIKDQFKDCKYYVIEDSQHGVKSAISAGMNVIFFNPQQEKIKIKPSYTIFKMKEIKKIIKEIISDCKIIAISSKIEFKFKNINLNITPEQEKIVNKLWQEKKEKNKYLYNDKIVIYASHYLKENKLIIEYFLTEYKFFFAQLNIPYLKLDIAPIAVSGIIFDNNRNTLIAKRKNVTEYKNFYEFVPSGGISASNIKGKEVLFIKQLGDEFKEEVGMEINNIEKIEPFCLILDKSHNVYDICCKIFLKTSIKINRLGKEYTAPKIIKVDNLKESTKNIQFIPTSKLLIKIIKT